MCKIERDRAVKVIAKVYLRGINLGDGFDPDLRLRAYYKGIETGAEAVASGLGLNKEKGLAIFNRLSIVQFDV